MSGEGNTISYLFTYILNYFVVVCKVSIQGHRLTAIRMICETPARESQ